MAACKSLPPGRGVVFLGPIAAATGRRRVIGHPLGWNLPRVVEPDSMPAGSFVAFSSLRLTHLPQSAVCPAYRRRPVAPVDNNIIKKLPVPFPWPTQTNVNMLKQPDLLILKLMGKLGDTDPLTRRNAAGALRLQGSRAVAAIAALSVLLTDQDVRVRNEAERAIDHLRLVAA